MIPCYLTPIHLRLINSTLRTDTSKTPTEGYPGDRNTIRQQSLIKHRSRVVVMLIASISILFTGTMFAGGHLKNTIGSAALSSASSVQVSTDDLLGLLPASYDDANINAVATPASSVVVNPMEAFAAGAYIINMGITPQTVNNGMKPYT